MKHSHQRAAETRHLMVHYMPWYEANPEGKSWGWHWTMNHFKPEQQKNGRREAASQYYPLLGLYDSNDADVLECHVLLMKLAGIDGVIVDWYGDTELFDYALIHRNTQHLFQMVKRAGMRFAVMFEDQTVPKLLEADRLPGKDVVAHGQRFMKWVRENWFADAAYLTRNKRPVLLTFGSGYYTGEQWGRIFEAVKPVEIQFFTEHNRRAPAVGAFDWPKPGGGTETALKECQNFYRQAKEWEDFIPVAFPRFHDIYEAANLHKSYGRIEDRAGKTFEETLEQALKSDAPVVQIATWNDWGEGTVIEPSVEFGCRDLEATQRLRRKHLEPRFAGNPADLRLPLAVYALRKQYRGKGPDAMHTEEAARLLFAGKVNEARALLKQRFPKALKEAERQTLTPIG